MKTGIWNFVTEMSEKAVKLKDNELNQYIS